MNTLEVFWGVCGWVGGGLAVMSPHDESTHLESGVEDRGMRSLSQIISDESLSYSLKHISTGEHSLHISLRSTDAISYIYISCFYDDVIKWKHVPRHWLMCRNSPVTAGKSPVNSPHTDRRRGALMFFFDMRLNKRLSKQSRRRWFQAPWRSLWRHCNVVLNSDPVIRAAVGSFGVQRVTLVQFWIGETGQIGGSRALWKEWSQIWHTALPWYHSLKLTIFCTQRQLKFVVSDHP